MLILSKYKSSVIEAGKRILKSVGIGGSAMTTKECYPFGFDSQAPEDLTAIYSETANRGEAVIVGYINKWQLAAAGESRSYAVGANGELVSFIYCKANGTIGLNGFQHNSVRFGPLDFAIQAQNVLINAEFSKVAATIAVENILLNAELAKINTTIISENTAINAELTKIAASISSLGGSYILTPINGAYTPGSINGIYTPGAVSTNLGPAKSATVKLK